VSRWASRIRAGLAASGHVPDDDVIEELAQHAQSMYDAARADGRSRAGAEHAVDLQIALWADDRVLLKRRRARTPAIIPPPAPSGLPLAGLLHDIQYGVRLLGRDRRFTVLASLTMALGICATTVLFSVTYGVLMKPLPWPEADRLIVLDETRGGKRPRFNAFSNAAYVAWRDEAATIESLGAWSLRTVTLSGSGDPDRIRIADASSSLFAVLRARPLIGSLYAARDEPAANVVVLAESLWRERFGADPGIVGHVVHLDGQPHVVVGVLPDAQAYPDARTRAWVPFDVPRPVDTSLSMFNAIARLRPGVSPAQAASEGTARGRFVKPTAMTTTAIFGGDGPVTVAAVPLQDALTADVRRPLILLMVAVGLLLVTAAANVAGLQLARATARRREMAIRAALGAGTVRVMRQVGIESLLLGATGGAMGVALAVALDRVLPTVLPADFPRTGDVGFSPIVLLFAVGVSVVASAVAALLPILRLRRLDLVQSLSEDGAAPVGTGSSSRIGRTRLVIMASQIAIACTLLVGASLLGRSFIALLGTDRGYDPAGLLTARISMPQTLYTPERRYVMLAAILDRLSAMPMVLDAAFTSELPLTPGGSTAAFTFQHAGNPVTAQASPRIVSPKFFAALRMRLVAGRGFSDSDTDSSPPVVVVNSAFARRYLDGEALGAKLPMRAGYGQNDALATVIGVVGDVRYVTGSGGALPEIYYSFQQFRGQIPLSTVTLFARSTVQPAALAPGLRSAVREIDGALVPEAIMTMDDRLLLGFARPRLYTILLGGFACFAVAVAAAGLFGVLSQTVAARSREIAVRSALGARPAQIVRLVVGQGLAITGVGLMVGITAAAALAQSMASLLYGITPLDWLTYTVVPLTILAVAATACFVPARRAAGLDPARVLRR
jgi:putative ABC transport system permease protein